MVLKLSMSLLAIGGLVACAGAIDTGVVPNSINVAAISKSKQTPYDLYVTPKEAYAAMQSNPSIILIDVRDPVELNVVGHPSAMNANIPIRLISGRYDALTGGYKMKANDNFVSDVDAFIARRGLSKSNHIIVSCRSGARSAQAARLLHAAGYETVWNQVEGFEGSLNKSTGERSKNGWRNAGLPWTYKISKGTEWRPSTAHVKQIY